MRSRSPTSVARKTTPRVLNTGDGLFINKAEVCDLYGIVTPVFLYLDPQVQIHLNAKEGFEVFARIRTDFFQRRTVLADENALVRFTLTKDLRTNRDICSATRSSRIR